MKCDNEKEQITRWITGQMTEAEKVAFESHMDQCPACRQEAQSSQQVWDLMGKMPAPEPSAIAPVRFHAMLDTYKRSVDERRSPLADIIEKIRHSWAFQPRFPLAYSLILVVAGLGAGYLIDHRSTARSPSYADQLQIDTLSSQ